MPNCATPLQTSRPWIAEAARLLIVGAILCIFSTSTAATVGDAEDLLRSGEYEDCIKLAAEEIDAGIRLERWRHVKAEAELALGRYADALDTIEEGLDAYPVSIQMRLLAHQVYRYNGQSGTAASQLNRIDQLVRSRPRRHSSPTDLLALGEYLLMQGADARQVLELCFDPVTEQFPQFIEGHLATAELALEKYDNRLAAQTLRAAPEESRNDPRYHYLLARAYARDDPGESATALAKALELNARHADSLLMQAEQLIDGEQYREAGMRLEKVLKINSKHPLAHAYQAVLANLQGDSSREVTARKSALATWEDNPWVDYTIGRKLSDKYRFAEGATYQRQALELDSTFLPARVQLAQDLLRLGREEEGWQLIHDVAASDGYNVVAHNLVTLHDSLDTYRVLADDSFRVRMETREASLYGQQVLDLLAEAKEVLTAKYDVELDEPVVVDIFPSKNDFAVRTFGLPGADGFLGVCFGNVITANSPAALGETRANWQAVLWHEFCHVVTLHKSRNKMPRWLSEGISVYEELQRDPSWGQRMTPRYRQMIIEGEMAPLSELSSMFLAPKSPLHLQFAYYESAKAVEYLVDQHGLETIKRLLDDLGEGGSINEALIRHVGPLGRLDAEFRDYMMAEANRLAPDLDWEEPELPATASAEEVGQWLAEHPDNFYGLIRHAQALMAAEQWQQAAEPAGRLRELYPEYVGQGNAYELLARIHRELGDTEAELEILKAWCRQDADAVDAYFRLMELGQEGEDWRLVAENAQRMLAVDPLSPAPHRYLARAAEQLGTSQDAIAARRALLQFDTTDPVDAHYRLAQLLAAEGERDEARREVLMALEDAPRFLQAHRLLLNLVEPRSSESPDDAADTEQPTADGGNEPESEAAAPASDEPATTEEQP